MRKRHDSGKGIDLERHRPKKERDFYHQLEVADTEAMRLHDVGVWL